MSGDVKDEEMLARFVNLERDDFVDEDNKIRSGALPTEQIFPNNNGWSLCREMHVTSMSDRLQQHAKTDTSGQLYGYASVRALDARQITDKKGNQVFCIIADPIEGDPAHALAKRADEYSKSQLRIFRKILLAKFSEVKTGDN